MINSMPRKIRLFSISPILVLIMLLCALFACSASNMASIRAQNYMQDEKYDLAIKEYNNLLAIESDPLKKSCALNNLGTIYVYLGDYNIATEYFLKSIEAMPERAYFGYINLAWLNLIKGKNKEASEYGSQALRLANTSNYERLERRTGYDKDALKRYIIATNDEIKIKLLYERLFEAYEVKNYKSAIELASQMLNQDYHIELGIDVVKNVVSTITKGSIADLNNIVKGDHILKIEENKIGSVTDFYNNAANFYNKSGSVMRMEIKRNNRIINMQVQLVYPEIEKARFLLQESRRQIAKGAESYDPNMKDTQAPNILILDPKPKRSLKVVGKERIIFVILASDNVEVKDVFVNDAICAPSEPSDLEKSLLPGKVKRFTASLTLLAKNNIFKIKATDTSGNTTIKQIEVESTGDKSENDELGKLYDHSIGVIIGINKYKNWPGLEYAVNDAKAVFKKLQDLGFEKIYEIYDDQATRLNLNRILGDTLPTLLDKNDRLIVYFAGHGATEILPDGVAKEGYIVAVDSDVNNFTGTSISMSSIHSMIKKYRAKHILFIFDSCYSGLMMKRAGGTQKNSGFIKKLSQEPAVQIITAGGQNEQAAEEKGHGVFTNYLLMALDGKADLDGDGFILGSEIGQFIRPAVSEKTGNRQNPQYGWLVGEGDFIFEK